MLRWVTITLFLFSLVACNRRSEEKSFALLFEDLFNRPDQALSATANWVVATPSASVFVLQNQKAYPAQGSGAAPSAFFNALIARNDVLVTVDINTIGGTMASPRMLILARYDASSLSGSTGGYMCGFNGGNSLTIIRNSSTITSSAKPIDFSPGRNYVLTFNQSDNVIFCTLSGDDTDQIGFTDSAVLRGNYAGLSGGVATTNYAYFDNFRIYGR